ncbi:hypothetical protein [Streptomyces sp. NPDC059788]|uniref:hypothetical protein n=1 Tax=Streptomyces sp. NPDC059788 TaxID=3346948 RepID=UPI003650DCF2
MAWIICLNYGAKRDTSARCTSPKDQERDNREWSGGHLSGTFQAQPSEESTELFASRPPMPEPWVGHGPVGPARGEMPFTDGRFRGRDDNIWMQAPCCARTVEVGEL